MCWITEKARNFRKTSISASLTMLKSLTVWITTNWKILREKGIPDHLTCILRNLYAGQEAKLELDMEQQIGSKLGKEHIKAVCCHPAYLTCIQSTSCEMLGWMKHKLESRFLGETQITSDMQMTPHLWQKWRGTKEPLNESERGEWKSWFKLNIEKMKSMASGPITSWQLEWETMEIVTDFIFVGSKITADGYCSHEIKRYLLFERKVMTNLESILKSRDICLF